ncbi:hypothetical protein TRVL_05476 [Trypanosoma vivax]|nr:hypothetical protein TRVL_05476 [Trypanosoma vivax]
MCYSVVSHSSLRSAHSLQPSRSANDNQERVKIGSNKVMIMTPCNSRVCENDIQTLAPQLAEACKTNGDRVSARETVLRLVPCTTPFSHLCLVNPYAEAHKQCLVRFSYQTPKKRPLKAFAQHAVVLPYGTGNAHSQEWSIKHGITW